MNLQIPLAAMEEFPLNVGLQARASSHVPEAMDEYLAFGACGGDKPAADGGDKAAESGDADKGGSNSQEKFGAGSAIQRSQGPDR